MNDDAVILGLLSTARSYELGDVIETAVHLAQTELSPPPTDAGVPALVKKRPLVFVSCNELVGGSDALLRAANHLVKDLQVPVVIGPEDASAAQLVASSVTLPNKVLHIVPTAITSSLDSLPNPIAPTPLLWRLNFSDKAELDLLQPLITDDLIPKLRADGVLGSDEDLRIAIVTEAGFEGSEVGDAVTERLTWNLTDSGSPAHCSDNMLKSPTACITGDFGSPDDSLDDPTFDGKITSLLDTLFTGAKSYAPPHVILHAYSTFGIEKVFVPLESNWDAAASGSARPYHVGLFPAFNAFEPLLEVMDWSAEADAAPGKKPLRQRVFAFDAHEPAASDTSAFSRRFVQAFPGFASSRVIGARQVRLYYDAVYMAAYAIAANGDQPRTGANLAATLPRLLHGESIATGPDQLAHALETLAAPGGSIDLNGLSGSLDLNPATGAPTYSVDLTCPGRQANGEATTFVASGFYYDEASQRSDGAGVFQPDKTGCPYLK